MTPQPSTGPRPRTDVLSDLNDRIAANASSPSLAGYQSLVNDLWSALAIEAEARAAAFTAVEEAVRAERQPIDRSPVAYDVMTRRGAFDDVLAVLAKLQEDALHPADKEAETSHE